MLKKTVFIALSVFITSVVVSFLVGEFIVRGVSPQITYKQAKVVGLRIFEESDTVPITLQPNLQTNHLGYTREFDHEVRTNNLGFRGEDITQQKPADTFRILFLGDSMTFGWGVEDNQTFPFLLQEYLNRLNLPQKIEVINAGFADGYSPDSYYAFLRSRGLDLEPDLIILTFFPYNDISDLLEMEWTKTDEAGYPLAVQSLDRMAKNGYQTYRVKTEWKYEIPILKNSHLAMLLFQALENNSPQTVTLIKKTLDIQEPPSRTTVEETSKCLYDQDCEDKFTQPLDQVRFLLKGFKQLADQQEIKLLTLIMASPDQAKPLAEKIPSKLEKSEKLAAFAAVHPQKELLEYLESISVPSLDLLPHLADQQAKAYFYGRDGHLTAVGTKKVAQTTAKELVINQTSLLDNLVPDMSPQDLTIQLGEIFKEINP